LELVEIVLIDIEIPMALMRHWPQILAEVPLRLALVKPESPLQHKFGAEADRAACDVAGQKTAIGNGQKTITDDITIVLSAARLPGQQPNGGYYGTSRSSFGTCRSDSYAERTAPVEKPQGKAPFF
jgi:hypothetical protein